MMMMSNHETAVAIRDLEKDNTVAISQRNLLTARLTCKSPEVSGGRQAALVDASLSSSLADLSS